MSEETTKLHPVGEYQAELKKVAVGEAGTGTKFIGLVWLTQFGEVKQQLWLSAGAVERTKEQLAQHLDFRKGRLSDLKAKVGVKARIKVEHESYKDKLQARVQFASETKIYDEAEADNVLADVFGSPPATSQQPQQATTQNESDVDDEVPF